MSCGGPSAQTNTAAITNVTVAEADQLSEENLFILDVRTPGEYKDGHMEGAVMIDWMADGFDQKVQAQVAKDQPVLVYCKVGGRSSKAAAKLEALGYTKIYHMHEGYDGYKKAHPKH